MVQVRKGQATEKVDRDTFGARYRESLTDPALDAERGAIDRLEAIAWLCETSPRSVRQSPW
jgi:hypothetical protein